MFSLVLGALASVVLVAVYKIYTLMWVWPRHVMHFYAQQGIKHHPFRFLVGQIPEIRKAAQEHSVVELALEATADLGYVHVMFSGFIPQLCLNDPELLRDVFGKKAACYHKASNDQKDLLRPLLKNGLLLSEDDHWKENREFVSPAFHYQNLKDMVPMMVGAAVSVANAWTNQLEQRLANGHEAALIEISGQMNKLTLDTVATAAFGSAFKDPERAETFTHAQRVVLDAIQERTLNLTAFIPVVRKLPMKSRRAILDNCRTIENMIHQIVQDRKDGKCKAVGGRVDLLDLLLRATLDDGTAMPQEAVEEETMNFITAGAETTSNLLTWTLYRMATEEGLWTQCSQEVATVVGSGEPSPDALKDLKFIEAVIYECLRLHAPAPMLPKLAIKDHVLAEGTSKELHVEQGTSIMINSNVVHRHPDYWPNPLEFRPQRFLATDSGERHTKKTRQHPYAFLGFSAGPRKCIGKNFAMLEIKVILCCILQRFHLQLEAGQRIVADSITRLPVYGINMKVSRAREQDLKPLDHAQSDGAEIVKPLGMI